MQKLKLHERKWNKCSKCKIGTLCSNHVLYRGSVPAKVLFIGEAPGHSEDTIGQPFVGPSGELLDEIIHKADHYSFTYAMTNVIACYPDDEKGGFRKPKRSEILKCSSRLVEFINICNPLMVVTVGDTAKETMVLLYGDELTFKVVHIQHPSFILRTGGQDSIYFDKNVTALTQAYHDLRKDIRNAGKKKGKAIL